jgi:hypothetical protein
MRLMRSGTRWEATAITPVPPALMMGSVMLSSPESTANSAPQVATISWTCASEPLASFTPTMFGMRASRAIVSGSTFEPVRPGML